MRDIPWVPEVGHLPGAVANPLFAERLPVLLSLRSVYEIHHDVAECCQKNAVLKREEEMACPRHPWDFLEGQLRS